MHHPVSMISFENEEDVAVMRQALQDTIDSNFGQNHSYMMEPYKNILKRLSTSLSEIRLVSNEIECVHIALSNYHEMHFDPVSDRLMKDLARNIKNVRISVKPMTAEAKHEAIIPFAAHAAEYVF